MNRVTLQPWLTKSLSTLSLSAMVCCAMAFASPTLASGEPPPRLFELTGAKAQASASDDRAVTRRQTVIADLGVLDGMEPPARLTIDLFGEARVVRLESVHSTLVGSVYLGRVEDAAGELITDSLFTLASGDGVMTADVILPTARFSLHPTAGGEMVLDAIDVSARPPGAEPILATGLFSKRAPDFVGKDSGSRIDVMVVYTGLARERAGGVAALEQRIATGIVETNRAFADSGVATSVRLVHAVELPYVEGNWDIGIDVEALQRKGDGRLDQAHTLRDQYGADLVAMIGENSTGACGIAYLMDGATNAAFEAEAFSYTARPCLNGSFTFTHELAHNMGSNHARDDPIKEGAYNFSYGWKDPAFRFRTVMAYPCGGACPQLLRFSNPLQTWNGAVMGDGNNDNTRSLQGVRPTVANFRQQQNANRGRIELVSDSLSEVESGGSVAVRVRRVGGAAGAVSVGYRTVGRSAMPGADFVATEGRLQWASGEANGKSFDVALVDDATEEETETLAVELFDVQGGATLGSASAVLTIEDDDEEPFQPFTCIANATTLCLQDGRFQVRLSFRANGEQGVGQVVEGAGSLDSGLYYLFDAANWEMLVKVLDACAISDRFWVLAAATTDVGFTLEVIDSQTGATRRYDNPVGRAAEALIDTNAFAGCR